jgi:hypothetical protein
LRETLDIGLITETFPPEVNGVAMPLGRLSTGLQSLGRSVRVFRPRQSRRDTARRNGTYSEHLPPPLRLPMYHDLQLGPPAAGRLAEHIRHNETGILVGDGFRPDFAESVVHLYRQPQRIRELGRGAAVYARHLDWNTVVERFAGLLGGVAARDPTGRPVPG